MADEMPMLEKTIRGGSAREYKPLGPFVLIRRLDDDLEMDRGIVIPEIGRVKSNKGIVIAIGEGRLIAGRLEPLPLEPGEVVVFSKYGAMEVKLEGDEYLLLRFDEIYLKAASVGVSLADFITK